MKGLWRVKTYYVHGWDAQISPGLKCPVCKKKHKKGRIKNGQALREHLRFEQHMEDEYQQSIELDKIPSLNYCDCIRCLGYDYQDSGDGWQLI